MDETETAVEDASACAIGLRFFLFIMLVVLGNERYVQAVMRRVHRFLMFVVMPQYAASIPKGTPTPLFVYKKRGKILEGIKLIAQ